MHIKIFSLFLFICSSVTAESCIMQLNLGGITCEAYKSESCSILIDGVNKNLENTFHTIPSCTNGRDGISCKINIKDKTKIEVRDWFTHNMWENKCCLKAGESHCI